MAERTLTVSVGSPLTLSVNARDISERDPDDFRNFEGIPLRVVWFKLQGPGRVEYTRHGTNPLPEVEEEDDAAGDDDDDNAPPAPEVITLPEGHGVARVIATFSEPGEYIVVARVDNWSATDSSSGSQCCWTNGYVRVSVTP